MMGNAKWVGALSAAIVAGSLLTIGSTAAFAAKPAVTPGSGSSVNCTFGAKVKLSPPLKNDWNPSDYQNDPDAGVRNAPFVAFAAASPVTIGAKGKSLSCSGSVVDANTHVSYPVTGLKLTANATVTASPPHADCAGLTSPPANTTFQSTVNWKLDGATMSTPTVVTSTLATLLDAHGVGFELTSQSISGPFAGGSSDVKAYIDSATFTAMTAGPGSSTSPSASVCYPRMKIKPATAKKAEVVKQMSGKGLKKILITNALFDGTPSSLAISLP